MPHDKARSSNDQCLGLDRERKYLPRNFRSRRALPAPLTANCPATNGGTPFKRFNKKKKLENLKGERR